MTVVALANMIAAMVDAMSEAEVPPLAIHRFLDCLDRLNRTQLCGEPLELLSGMVDVVRRTVPCND